jgi:cobalt-zinc-cadmium resistance protein CzcA
VLIEGVIFVVIVLFLFLGDLRSSVIVIATLVSRRWSRSS